MLKKTLKNKVFLIMNLLLTIWLSACATQGRLTSLTFNRSENFKELDSSIEKLKKKYNASIRQQISALKVLRFISKHNPDPGKKEMALNALTFFAFSSDDGDIRDRSKSRLIKVLESEEFKIHLKFKVIDSLIDLSTGELGYNEEHDGVEMHFGVSSEIRKDALKFLIENFNSFSSKIQYYTVDGIYRLLKTLPKLDNCPEDLCDEDVRKNQEEWDLGREVKNIIPSNADPSAVEAGAYGAKTKRVILEERKEWNAEFDELKEFLWDWIEDRLEDLDTDFIVQGKLVRFSGEIENFSLQENIENDFIEQTKKWSENEDITIELRQLIISSREKVELYGFPAKKSPKLSEEKYKKIIESPTNFLEKHLDSILHEKLERQQSGFATGQPETIELAFAIFEENGEGLLKREIVMEYVSNILKKGLIVNTENLNNSVLKAIERTRSEIELIPLMKMVSELYPSLKSQKGDPVPLFETLAKKIKNAENLFQQRLFLKTLITGAEVFNAEASLILNLVSADEYDVVTQNDINSAMQKIQEMY
tara:strand:- start:555 stop:2162 length:1608 start_codon:yes stop_codon:yes gene_type:complete